MADEDRNALADKVVVLLIAMGSAAIVVSAYHLIAICLCNQHITDQNPPEQARRHRQPVAGEEAAQTPCPDEGARPAAHVIPAHKYRKKIDAADDDEDGTCVVCLGDFEEGEELRTLPECMHSFHVPCIDTWLCSHSSCPICRATLPRDPVADFGSGESDAHHSIDMMQIALVQNGLVRM